MSNGGGGGGQDEEKQIYQNQVRALQEAKSLLSSEVVRFVIFPNISLFSLLYSDCTLPTCRL